jgi:hypothetical protein
MNLAPGSLLLASCILIACGGAIDPDKGALPSDLQGQASAGGAQAGSGQAEQAGQAGGGQAAQAGSGQAEQAGGGQAGQAGQGGQTGQATVTPYDGPAAACGQPEQGEQGEQSFASQAEFEQAISGRWSLCSKQSTFCTSDEQGLEIAPDHRWYKLYAENGQLVRGQGFDHQGTWDVIDTSSFNGPGVYQLNLNIDGSGTVITIPVIAVGPHKMRLNNNGVCQGDYAIDP